MSSNNSDDSLRINRRPIAHRQNRSEERKIDLPLNSNFENNAADN